MGFGASARYVQAPSLRLNSAVAAHRPLLCFSAVALPEGDAIAVGKAIVIVVQAGSGLTYDNTGCGGCCTRKERCYGANKGKGNNEYQRS